MFLYYTISRNIHTISIIRILSVLGKSKPKPQGALAPPPASDAQAIYACK